MSYSIPSFCKGSIRGDGADRWVRPGGHCLLGEFQAGRGSDGLQPCLGTSPPSKSRRVPCLQDLVSPLCNGKKQSHHFSASSALSG